MRTRGLVFAMEEAEAELPVEGDAIEQQVAEASAEVEASTAETVEQVADVEEVTGAVDDAVADSDTLEGIQDVMAESVERGEGLDETAAAVAEVAVEAICARLGIRTSGRVLPAMESFGSKNSRVAATKIAMEGIGDKISAIWEAIKKAFKNVWMKIKDFFAKFFSNTEAVKKLAASLKSKAEDLKGSTAKETTMKVGGLASMIGFGTKADAASAKQILDNQISITNSFLASAGAIETVIKTANDALKAGKDIGNKVQDLAKSGKDLSTSILKGGKSEDKDGSTVTTLGPLVGGSSIVVSTGKVNSVDVTNGEQSKAESIPVLSLDECSKLCDEVTAAMVVTEEFKKKQALLDKLNAAALAAADSGLSFAKKLDGEDGAKVASAANEARKTLVSVNNMTTRLITMIPSWNVKAGKATLNYVGKSLAQYGKEEKKEEKK